MADDGCGRCSQRLLADEGRGCGVSQTELSMMSGAMRGELAPSCRSESTWVVGGAGFLGSRLAALCREAGERTLVIDTKCVGDVPAPAGHGCCAAAEEPRGIDGGAEHLCGDAACPELLQSALELTGPPRFVYVCTATHGAGPELYARAYAGVLRALAERVSGTGARLLFCSSVSVYAEAGGGAVDESSPRSSAPGRVAALCEAEDLALTSGGSVARLVPLYDEGRCELLRRHLSGEARLPGGEERWLNYVHREDAAAALRLMATRPPAVFNVCSESLRLGEAYAMLEAVTGLPRSSRSAGASCRGLSNRRVLSERLRAAGWLPRFSLRGEALRAVRDAARGGGELA